MKCWLRPEEISDADENHFKGDVAKARGRGQCSDDLFKRELSAKLHELDLTFLQLVTAGHTIKLLSISYSSEREEMQYNC